MIDAHSHVLHGVDDGPRNIGQSLGLFSELKRQGVTGVVCSTHYYPEQEQINGFLSRYQEKFNELRPEAEKQGLKLISGAEVFISRRFTLEPVCRELCINKGQYILIELPYERIEPWVFEGLKRITEQGFVPIIAHIEIYPAYTPELAGTLVRTGCLLQINASSVNRLKLRMRINKLIKNGLADFIGSDAHNMNIRMPYLSKAFNYITKKFGEAAAERFKLKSLELGR